MMADDHRMAGRVADAGFEADRFQIGGQPFGCPAAFGFEGGIGRDGLDLQEIEQPLQAFVEIIVERIQAQVRELTCYFLKGWNS